MKNRFITLLGIITISPFMLMAQEYDDIYYDGSKDKSSTKNITVIEEYTNLSKTAPVYQQNIVDERDVDEYNRRGAYDLSNPIDTISGNDQNFVYTGRIEKFHNPSVVENQNDSVLEVLYYASAPTTTVNVIVGASSYYDPWSFGFGGSYYDPWNWRYSSYYNPWYSSYYNPWGWDHHHHHHYPGYYPGYYPSYPTYPTYYSNNNGRRPYGYNSGYASNGRRPGYGTNGSTVSRPGQSNRPSNDRQNYRRPGYSERNNNGNSSGTYNNRRPGAYTTPVYNNDNRRPSTSTTPTYNHNNRRQSDTGTDVRPSTTPTYNNNRENSNYRENNRRESYSTPSYNSGGSSRGGYSGGGSGGNRGGGGGRR